MGRRLVIAAAVLALVPSGAAAASPGGAGTGTRSWAAPEIASVTSAGLMGAADALAFRPDDPLTAQALEELVFGLKLAVLPPLPVVPVAPPSAPPVSPVVPPVERTPEVTTVTTTTPTTTTPTTTTPTTTTPTTTTAVPGAPTAPRRAAHPEAPVTMTQLDTRLVQILGLSKAASEFAQGARAAGLRVPPRFGTEVVARLLGLRTNHPAEQDGLELLPGDHATRAEAAYSAAQVLRFSGWELAGVQGLADRFALPALTNWQTSILDAAVTRIGMPYVWGGTSDGPETDFGVSARGGYDCSGFVWRVYKLEQYPGGGSLPLTLRGRTTFTMSAEVPRAQRVGLAKLQPADVIFFGDRGPRSQPSQVGHMGIYLGNGWFIHSSDHGVALATLDGWYAHAFAWGRRPLAEAGLSG